MKKYNVDPVLGLLALKHENKIYFRITTESVSLSFVYEESILDELKLFEEL